MPMKHTLRYCFVLLALATTGLFAEAATEPAAAPAASSYHKTIKVAKHGKKADQKKHKKHKKKAAK